MPPPKKAAKKSPEKHTPKHDDAKDLRRAHEHAGRVAILRPSLGKNVTPVETLVGMAERELACPHPKDAADLLRAAEHLCFGLLASDKRDANVPPALLQNIEQEFEHKIEKAEEHWKETEDLSGIYQEALDGARKAFRDGAYRKALELARAAEALAHVHLHAPAEC